MSKLTLEDTKKSLQKTFMNFRSKNIALQFECDYLRKHIDINDLPAPSASLVSLQERNLQLATNCLQLFEKQNISAFLFGNALLGYARHNTKLCPWDDTIELGIMAHDFWRLVEKFRQENILFETNHIKNVKQEMVNIHFITFLDTIFSGGTFSHENAFFAVLTPFALQIYSGTSLENYACIDIMPWYYWKEDATSRDYVSHAKNIREKIQTCKRWEEIFGMYKKECENSAVYVEESKIIAPGVASQYLTNKKFSGFLPSKSIFPLQKIRLQNHTFYTFNTIEHYLTSNYGDYMQLPRDIGITTKSSVLEQYLQTKGRSLNMLEASVICKH